jgi:hypothetical protein
VEQTLVILKELMDYQIGTKGVLTIKNSHFPTVQISIVVPPMSRSCPYTMILGMVPDRNCNITKYNNDNRKRKKKHEEEHNGKPLLSAAGIF